ncbi:SDR family NAD(P)-dependent oxidoreductase [Mycolicibacterium sphagni]|uniref:SDR family NAD(P)-dependent oxidoreductase n=1 Tax=Mycolicibacterium sphagni TaxID=1786 RepID=UPI0021F34816|nr:glucose 1-dehydrogenase [Mycolicibacterium sphagni]MCV7177078.1 glucose 1-dehydrogenase [Mycolicibacterium sphagni]
MTRLAGKVAVITGGGKGIGEAIAYRFVEEGARVVIAELDAEAGKRVAAELTARGGDGVFVDTDVSKKADVDRAIAMALDTYGGIDILVNSAIALSQDVVLEQKTDEMFARTLDVTLWSVWWAMRSAFPHLVARGGGRIINFYSIDADNANWVHADYNTAKGAVQALTRTGAFQWSRYNILVNAIAPIAASAAFAEMVARDPAFGERADRLVPLGRMGDPERDIAPVAAFLASDDARYITGATIPVDGGLHIPRVDTRPLDASVSAGAPTTP